MARNYQLRASGTLSLHNYLATWELWGGGIMVAQLKHLKLIYSFSVSPKRYLRSYPHFFLFCILFLKKTWKLFFLWQLIPASFYRILVAKITSRPWHFIHLHSTEDNQLKWLIILLSWSIQCGHVTQAKPIQNLYHSLPCGLWIPGYKALGFHQFTEEINSEMNKQSRPWVF